MRAAQWSSRLPELRVYLQSQGGRLSWTGALLSATSVQDFLSTKGFCTAVPAAVGVRIPEVSTLCPCGLRNNSFDCFHDVLPDGCGAIDADNSIARAVTSAIFFAS